VLFRSIEDGHSVTNVSDYGFSNIDVAKQLKELLRVEKFDFIFLFVGDPLKDLGWHTEDFYNQHKIKKVKLFENYAHLLLIQENCEKQFYRELGKLKHTIHLIGGANKLNYKMIENYTNLIPIIKSVPSFLIPNYDDFDVFFSGYWLQLLDNTLPLETIEKLIEQKKKIEATFDTEYFVNADKEHPDRYGHYKMYEFIKEEILCQKSK
jgi:hypothetical protein